MAVILQPSWISSSRFQINISNHDLEPHPAHFRLNWHIHCSDRAHGSLLLLSSLLFSSLLFSSLLFSSLLFSLDLRSPISDQIREIQREGDPDEARNRSGNLRTIFSENVTVRKTRKGGVMRLGYPEATSGFPSQGRGSEMPRRSRTMPFDPECLGEIRDRRS
jgi:hypothetical protein